MAEKPPSQTDAHLPDINNSHLITREREPAAYVPFPPRTPKDFALQSRRHSKNLLSNSDHIELTNDDAANALVALEGRESPATSTLPGGLHAHSQLSPQSLHAGSTALQRETDEALATAGARPREDPLVADRNDYSEVMPKPPGSDAPTLHPPCDDDTSLLSGDKALGDFSSDHRVASSAATDADRDMVAAPAQIEERITDENIETRLQNVKDCLEVLRAAPDLCTDAAKYEVYFKLIANAMSPKTNWKAENRLKVATVLLDGGVSQLIIRYWKLLDMKSSSAWFINAGNRMTSYINLYRALISVTQCSDLGNAEVLAAVVRDLLDFILNALDNDALSEYTRVRLHMMTVKSLLGVLHHVVRRHDGGVQAVRDRDGVRIVGKYAAHDKCASKTKAILVLGHIIVEDDQKQLLEATDSHMTYLINVLKDCVAAGARRRFKSAKYGYSADDMLDGLNRMAVVDSNKLKIIKMGALPLYVSLMDARCTVEQQMAACQGIWTLAFCKENRDVFLGEPTCMEALHRLTRSGDASVRKAAQGALWVIEEEQKRVQGVASEPQRVSSNVRHIMMSYNWGVQKEVLKVRDRLQEAGYSIWIDVERMGGSTLEAMAKSIEDAAVVLIFFSDKYKTSAACRSEAEYTYKLGKEFIPIRMQPKYSPDGWLGMLLGTKYYFDLAKPGRWDDTVQALISQLGDRGKVASTHNRTTQEHEASSAGEIPASNVPVESQNTSQHPAESWSHPTNGEKTLGNHNSESGLAFTRSLQEDTSIVCGWSNENVRDWLNANHLSPYADKFDEFTGRHLVELQRMLVEAPAYCYGILEQQLGLRLPHILTFAMSLRELGR